MYNSQNHCVTILQLKCLFILTADILCIPKTICTCKTCKEFASTMEIHERCPEDTNFFLPYKIKTMKFYVTTSTVLFWTQHKNSYILTTPKIPFNTCLC